MERRPPPRAPEVLIRRVDVPGRGQIDVGCSPSEPCAAIDAIRQDVHGNATLIVLDVRVAVRVLEDVLQCTLGIVDLGLEVVAWPKIGAFSLRPPLTAQPHLSPG